MKTTRHWSLMMLMMMIAALMMIPMAISGSHVVADERDEADAKVQDNAAAPTLTLIEKGAEPRRALRMTAKPGDTQRIILSQRMHMEQMMNGMRMPSMPMPVTEFQLAIEVERVDDDGTIHYTGTYGKVEVKDEPGVDPNMRRMMEQSMQAIAGVTVAGAVTERGFIHSFELDADHVRDPMMRQILQGLRSAFEQSSLPLPEEPVGVGAKWKTESTITAQGMTMDMVSNITLEELAESGFDLGVELTMSAEEQPLEHQNAPAGMKMTLKSMDGKAEGRLAYQDGRLMPLSTTNTSTETDIEVEMTFNNQRQRMTQKMQIEQQIREAEAEAAPDADEDRDG
jgi:hypothetical protein